MWIVILFLPVLLYIAYLDKQNRIHFNKFIINGYLRLLPYIDIYYKGKRINLYVIWNNWMGTLHKLTKKKDA